MRVSCIAFTERGYAFAERAARALSDCAQTGEDDPGWDVSVSRGFGEGRQTCAHGRRSRGKRRTRFCSWARRASPCGRSRRMSPRRQTIPRLWRSMRRGALLSRFCRGIWAVRTSLRKLWHARQEPSPSSPRRPTSAACGRWIRGRAVRGSPFRIPRPSSECRRGCFRAGAWRSIPTCRFRDSRLRG